MHLPGHLLIVAVLCLGIAPDDSIEHSPLRCIKIKVINS